MNLEYPKLELQWSIMCKLTPCCRSEGIFALTFFKTILLRVVCLFEYVFGGKEKAKYLDENWYITSSFLNNASLFSLGEVVL